MNRLYVLILLLLPFSGLSQHIHTSSCVSFLEELDDRNLLEVTCISLVRDRLKEVPSKILDCIHLEHLDLSKNKISEIDPRFVQLKSLKTLNLSKNRLIYFPSSICALEDLTELSMSDNQIESVPDCIKYMSKLEKLDFFAVNFKHLPEILSELPNLKTLDLRGILVTKKVQERWTNVLMVGKEVLFDSPCNCLETN